MNSLNLVCKKLKKKSNKKIVLIGGCYDILHIGHLRILTNAKKYGNFLIVGINDDKFIKKTKGKNRPIIPAKQRAELLLSLKPVDYVFITKNELYSDKNLRNINPDFLVFGKEKNRFERRIKIAKKIEKKYPKIKTIFLSSGINKIRTTSIESKIIKNKIYIA